MNAFEQAVRTVQFLSVDGVEQAKSGHPGTPMALAGIATDIFTRYLRHDPACPSWPNRDRFVLSCGHASMLLYSLLHLAGYDVSLDDLKKFRQLGSKTPGHPENFVTPGVETTTGPLGQGVGNAVGLALASKMAGARLNQQGSSIIDYRVFALASDGDLMEGVASEAASIAGHLGLNNLILIYDDNRITIDGKTDISFSEDVAKRFEAYGWATAHVDGHNPDEVRRALDQAVAETARPTLIVARTIIAIGAPTKANTSGAHGSPLGAAEVEATKKAANWPLEPFHVPDAARTPFRERAEQMRPEREAWEQKVAALPADRAELYQKLIERSVPADLYEQLLAVAEPKVGATRSIAGKIEQRAAALVPALVGGAADLASSTNTTIKDGGDVRNGSYAGRNLHFGIREHGMAAVVNGLALSGFFIPFGSTFLVFADYLRPSLRLSALMGLQAVEVLTHDSIFLGEDGPTHQPIETIWSMRLIPNVDVVRPADAMECAAAWAHALNRSKGPTVLALSRQNLPPLERPAGFDPKAILDGAYVLSDAEKPDLVLIATGSEVELAVSAKRLLEQKGKRVRVVSAPCVEAFRRLPAEKQEAVLPKGVRRVSIEAGCTTPWRALIGIDGIAIGVDIFGASAPAKDLAVEYGLTPEQVAERVLLES
jgi:transketolase